MEEKEKLKKKNNLLKFLFPVLGVILIVAGVFLFLNTKNKGDDNNESKDKKEITLKDDYYEYVNKTSNKMWENAQRRVNQQVANLIKEIENDENYTDEEYYAYISTFDDSETRNANGLSELQPYFDEIDNASTLDEFSDIVIKAGYDLGVTSFLNWGPMADLFDTSHYTISFWPMILESLGTFTFNPSLSGLEFFSNEDYEVYKTAFENARVAYFEHYGYDTAKATELSNEITEFAKTIQRESKSIDEIKGNRSAYYVNYSLSELKALLKNLPIEKLLTKYNLADYPYFSIVDEGHFKALDAYYTEEHLPLMKEILKLMILEQFASLNTSGEYLQIMTDCYNGLTGDKVNANDLIHYYETYKLKPALMGSYLNIKYDEKYFTEIEKQEITELIYKIKDHYKEIVNSSEWLDESTKQEAQKKIDKMSIHVGFVQIEDIEFDTGIISKEDGGTLVNNTILYNRGYSGVISRLVRKTPEVSQEQFQLNAYYDSSANAIIIPSSFRELYRGHDDKYEMYGYVGMVAAHEISHGFDINGSKYDENGNLRNWWTEDDLNQFEELTQKIADYYSSYELYGYKVNGERTLFENIADLGAVKTIISIMENEGATNEDYQKFFEAFAKLWGDKQTKEEVAIALLDEHSPNKIRVNAVLSSMDKFYDVYDITEKDGMYVAKEDRVGIW